MLAFSALLLAALPLTAHAALAPRASPSPGDTYYRPPYSCASSITQYGTTVALSESDYRTDSNSFNCAYGSNIEAFCAYDATTGAASIPALGCPATLAPTSGCVYECALVETGGSALLEIPSHGFDLNKLVLGKPGAASDATNGFIDPATLGTCVDQAAAQGWQGGIMSFEFPSADGAWIQAAKGSSLQ